MMTKRTMGKVMKRATALLAAATLVLVVFLSNGALAETTEKKDADAMASVTSKGMGNTSASTLTDEEKAQAMATARSTYDAAVDAALVDILAVGGLSQEAVDSYHALRDAERLLEKVDTSNWTQDQIAAYQQGVSGNSVNETALAGLVSQGVLTEAEVAAIKLKYGDHVTITDLLSQVDTTKATPEMVEAMTQAREAYMQAMTDAGAGMGRGNGDGNRTR